MIYMFVKLLATRKLRFAFEAILVLVGEMGRKSKTIIEVDTDIFMWKTTSSYRFIIQKGRTREGVKL